MENPFASPVVKLTAQTHAHKALFARLILVVLLAAIFSAASFSAAGAQATAPSLGSAQSYAVLGGSTVTNTGPTIATGDLGVSPGTAVTGFPPGTVTGTILTGAAAAGPQADNLTALAFWRAKRAAIILPVPILAD